MYRHWNESCGDEIKEWIECVRGNLCPYVKDELQHVLNSWHILCRLLDNWLHKEAAKDIAKAFDGPVLKNFYDKESLKEKKVIDRKIFITKEEATILKEIINKEYFKKLLIERCNFENDRADYISKKIIDLLFSNFYSK